MTYDEVIDEATRLFGVHKRDLLGDAKYGFLLRARYAVYYALWARGTVMNQIARRVNRICHSTIANGMGRCCEMMETDRAYATQVLHLINYRNIRTVRVDRGAFVALCVAGQMHRSCTCIKCNETYPSPQSITTAPGSEPSTPSTIWALATCSSPKVKVLARSTPTCAKRRKSLVSLS